MPDIIRYETTDFSDTLQNAVKLPMQLVDENDSTSLILAAGSSEEVGGATYRVENGDYQVIQSGASGLNFVYITPDGGAGSDAAIAELLDDVPTYDPNLGGFYFGVKKAIYSVLKLNTANFYLNKTKLFGLTSLEGVSKYDLPISYSMAEIATQSIGATLINTYLAEVVDLKEALVVSNENNNPNDMQMYRFIGDTFTKLGTPATLTNQYFSGARLSDTEVAVMDFSGGLSKYTWSGSWTLNGARLPVTLGQICRLDSETIALGDSTTLKAYRFSGGAWGQVGNTLNLGATGGVWMGAWLQDNIVMVSDSGVGPADPIQVYYWDGTDFLAFGNPLTGLSASFYLSAPKRIKENVVLYPISSGGPMILGFDGVDIKILLNNPTSNAYSGLGGVVIGQNFAITNDRRHQITEGNY